MDFPSIACRTPALRVSSPVDPDLLGAQPGDPPTSGCPALRTMSHWGSSLGTFHPWDAQSGDLRMPSVLPRDPCPRIFLP